MSQEMVWHNDGHAIHLRINRSEVDIVSITCPHKEGGPCTGEHGDCTVSLLIDRYGLDCNAGSCPAAESIGICWTILGDKRDLDSCQLWFMPVSDETFQAWMVNRIN